MRTSTLGFRPTRIPERSPGATALLALLLLGACGGDGGATPASCSSDAQCAASEYCDVAGASAPLLDPECFVRCVEDTCDPSDSDCGLACAESCGDGEVSCGELCNDVCAGGPGGVPDPSCVVDCVPDCEAHRSDPPPPPPPPPADAGTTPPPPPPSGSGTCRPRTPPPVDGGTAGTDAGTPGTDAGTPPTPIDWTGTWNVHARLTSVCRFGSVGAPNNANLDYTVTAQLSGSNSSLTAVLAGDTGYTMTGTGTDARATLSGQFPGRDHNGNAATTVRRDNSVSITLDEVVDRDHARGTISGSYDTSGGIGCIIQSGGVIEFSR